MRRSSVIRARGGGIRRAVSDRYRELRFAATRSRPALRWVSERPPLGGVRYKALHRSERRQRTTDDDGIGHRQGRWW